MTAARKVGVIEKGVRGERSESIRRKMREIDTREWKKEMNEKTSLKIYWKWRQEKGGQEEIYNNNYGSQLLFKCRTNNLQLNERRRFRGEEITCDVCGSEKEDLIHFLLLCPGYRKERRKSVKLQQPYIQEKEEIVGRYLFDNEDIEEAKREITSFWMIRERLRKERERETEE